MKLTKVQNRYIHNKKLGFSVVRGKGKTGKTSATIYRMMNLENNYCIYENDNILYLGNNIENVDKVKKIYKEENNCGCFYSLFSIEKDRIEFNTVKQLIKAYADEYKRGRNLAVNPISNDDAMSLLIEDEVFVKEFDKHSKKSKLIGNISIDDLYDEFLWMKSCNLNREDYLVVERKRRKRRIKKNSFSREGIYSLYELYNELLSLTGKYDLYDDTLFAIKYSKNLNIKYTHLVLDDAQLLTKAELDFVNTLYRETFNSSLNYILNNEINATNGWLGCGRKLSTLGEEFKGKSYNFKTEFIANKEKKISNIEKYQYVNFKNKNISDFNLDTSLNNKEIYLLDGINFSEDELVEIPVFNDIAAGNPIEINDNIEDNFYLPKTWLERGKETFILHVKGDSMIEKNIFDGDLVVIKRQQNAYHNDIVAASVEGEATLKTLKTNGEVPMLMPENKRYSAISLENKEVSILGVALGVIRRN